MEPDTPMEARKLSQMTFDQDDVNEMTLNSANFGNTNSFPSNQDLEEVQDENFLNLTEAISKMTQSQEIRDKSSTQ